MTYKVIYLRHYEKINNSRIHLPGEYSFISLSRKFIFHNNNRYSYQKIQCIKTPGLSIFTKSNKSSPGTKDTRNKNGPFGKTSRGPNKGTAGTCKKVGDSIKYICRVYPGHIPQKKTKGWAKNLYRIKFSYNTTLTAWHQKNLFAFTNFLFRKILHQERKGVRIKNLF